MGEVRVFIKLLDGRDDERELYRLLKKYKGRVVAVALVLELEKQQQAGALVRHYNLRQLQLPLALLFEPDGV